MEPGLQADWVDQDVALDRLESHQLPLAGRRYLDRLERLSVVHDELGRAHVLAFRNSLVRLSDLALVRPVM
jgi:hypothetical protein